VSGSAVPGGEWIKVGLNELINMGLVVREELFMQLAAIETIHEELQSSLQGFGATRKTTRASCQTSQIMAQFGIACFDRIGISLALRDLINAQVIPQAIISIKSVAVIALRLGSLIHHFLDGRLGSLPNDLKAQITAGYSIYDRDDVDLVFFSPIKVNSSSISASLTSVGTGGSGSWAAWALTHKETVR